MSFEDMDTSWHRGKGQILEILLLGAYCMRPWGNVPLQVIDLADEIRWS